MRPISYRVHWSAHPDVTAAGYADYPQRARARGFMMTRKAMGFHCCKRTYRGKKITAQIEGV